MTISISIARAAQTHPNHVAIRHLGADITWAQEADRVARLAGGLRALGLRAGDRLAILSANVPENMEITYAAIWAGIVIVPLNTRLAGPEIDDILRRSGSRFLAFDQRNAARAGALTTPLDGMVALEPGTDQPAATEFARLLASDPLAMCDAEADDLLGIYYTGGTTGTPKGVELTQNAFHIASLNVLHEVGATADDVYLHSSPFFHLADCGLGHAITYAAGTHVFLAEATPATMLDAIARNAVTIVMSVPTGYHDLLAHMASDATLPEIRSVVYGAAPIPAELLRRMIRTFPNGRFVQFYGQTEACGMCTALRPEDHTLDNPRLATVGRATFSAQMRIGDTDGRELPRGETGEIQVKALYLMRGYRDDPERTAETLADGWLRTGDAGYMDDQGYITLVDRLKDMIISGGENVFSGEVETALLSHPDVVQAAVIGIPDPRWGEAVHAVVILRAGATADEAALIAHTRTLIAGYKCPKSVSFATALPLSAVGKIRKDQLRAQVTAARGIPSAKAKL